MTQRQTPIPVGFQWKHVESGKEWVVTGLRPGGVCEIYRVGRHVSGETNTSSIRWMLDIGASVRMETTEAARSILRRINGREFGA